MQRGIRMPNEYVIPAQAGIQAKGRFWIPAFAGMTCAFRRLVCAAVVTCTTVTAWAAGGDAGLQPRSGSGYRAYSSSFGGRNQATGTYGQM